MKKTLALLYTLMILLSACSPSSSMTPFPIAPTPKETSTPPKAIPSTPTMTPVPPTPTLVPESAFIKGITLNYMDGAKLDSTSSQMVIRQFILPTGANYVALSPTCWSRNANDTSIVCSNQQIPGGVPPVSDQELINTIQYLHNEGLSVILKPQYLVESFIITLQEQKQRQWNSSQWKAWSESYTAFITRYAQIAEEYQVDLFVMGNEQEDTTHREQEWRSIIAAVRDVYHGPITYAANSFGFEASQIKFWDALDYIGTNGYSFGFADKKNATVDDMVQAWQPYIDRLEEMSKQYGKQVIITEIGARSIQDFNPNALVDIKPIPYNGETQADYYTALFEALKNKPWLKGIVLWDVYTNPLQGGPNDLSFTFIAKPAEQVVHQYFDGSPLVPTPTPNFVEEPANSQWIYQEGLLNSWHLWDDPDAKILPDLYAHTGHDSSFSIQAPISKYRELQLIYDTPYVQMSNYKWVEFYIMVGKHEPTKLIVLFGYWTPEAYTLSRKASVDNPNYIENGQYIPGTWQRVRIPLIDLGITDQMFNEFHISACDWPCVLDTHVDDIYIDDIQLVAGK